MNYNFSPFKQGVKEVEEWLKKEFSQIRTGRASPAILDSVMVESYGSRMPINQVGNITLEGARSMKVVPWDMSQAKAIEKAILVSNLGLSVSVDDTGVRISFPELTTERREALIKVAKQKLEDARVSLRTEREKVLKDIDAQEKAGTINKDDKFRFKNELQKMIDEIHVKFEELTVKKEIEISG